MKKRMVKESLNASNSFWDVLHYLSDYHEDKVAKFLLDLSNDPAYADEEDLNFIHLNDNLRMLSFIPVKRRPGDLGSTFRLIDAQLPSDEDKKKSTSIRIGRLVRNIFDKVKPYMHFEEQVWSHIQKDIRTSFYTNYSIFFDKELKTLSSFLNIKLLDENGNIVISSSGYEEILNPKQLLSKYGSEIIFQKNDEEFKAKSMMTIMKWNTVDISGRAKISHNSYQSDSLVRLKNEDMVKLLSDGENWVRRKLIITSGVEIGDRDIELFGNRLSDYLRTNKSDDDSKFVELSGQNIENGYNSKNYQSMAGELGSSCMSDCFSYIQFYCDNESVVSLITLLNKDGLILGRALKWKMSDGRYFLDRVYTILDSDKAVFYKWAREQGFLFKVTELGERYIRDGEKKIPEYDFKAKVELDECIFNYYPYVDTFSILSPSDCCLYTYWPKEDQTQLWELHDTEGGYRIVREGHDDDDDD